MKGDLDTFIEESGLYLLTVLVLIVIILLVWAVWKW